jgi:hypothetical protein
MMIHKQKTNWGRNRNQGIFVKPLVTPFFMLQLNPTVNYVWKQIYTTVIFPTFLGRAAFTVTPPPSPRYTLIGVSRAVPSPHSDAVTAPRPLRRRIG